MIFGSVGPLVSSANAAGRCATWLNSCHRWLPDDQLRLERSIHSVCGIRLPVRYRRNPWQERESRSQLLCVRRSPQLAYSMRTIVGKDRMPCQVPTPDEFAFLMAQRAARKDTGFPVGSEGYALAFPLMGFWRR